MCLVAHDPQIFNRSFQVDISYSFFSDQYLSAALGQKIEIYIL